VHIKSGMSEGAEMPLKIYNIAFIMIWI